MILFERRATAILHTVLCARADGRPFLMPANACRILPAAFAEAGQPIELVDISEPWLEIDTTACTTRLRARRNAYAGLLFIHPYGCERDATPLFAAVKAVQSDLFVIDDKCLCRPDPDGDRLSPLADLTLFSTGHAKYADLDGGGFAHLVAESAHGITAAADEPWRDYRRRVADAIDAADGRKAALNAIYARTLPVDVQLATELQRWRFNIRVPEPDRLVDEIFAAGLFASRHYPAPGGFAVAKRLEADIVNLFNDRYFDAARARRVSELVLRHLDIIGR